MTNTSDEVGNHVKQLTVLRPTVKAAPELLNILNHRRSRFRLPLLSERGRNFGIRLPQSRPSAIAKTIFVAELRQAQ